MPITTRFPGQPGLADQKWNELTRVNKSSASPVMADGITDAAFRSVPVVDTCQRKLHGVTGGGSQSRAAG